MIEFEERLAIADLKDIKNKKAKVLECLQFGLKMFPDNVDFSIAMIDRLIAQKNYEQAENMIESTSTIFEGENKERILLKKAEILKLQKRINEARDLLKRMQQ